MSIIPRTFPPVVPAPAARLLDASGVTLTVGLNFAKYHRIMRQVRPDHPMSPPFDPARHDLANDSAFWILGRDQTGAVVHSQALRLINLGESSLGSYLRTTFRDFAPPMVGVDLARSRYRPAPATERMFGRVAYHGEFWIGGVPGQFRGRGLAAAFTAIGFAQAQALWNPDHLFAFIADKVAFKGLPARAGWMHQQPGAVSWAMHGSAQTIDGFMAYNAREDVSYLASLQAEEALAEAA